jgi:hypothetical protein
MNSAINYLLHDSSKSQRYRNPGDWELVERRKAKGRRKSEQAKDNDYVTMLSKFKFCCKQLNWEHKTIEQVRLAFFILLK